MCRSAGCTWKFPNRSWPGERGNGKHPNHLHAAGTDFFTTTFYRQIRVWISISWLAKVGRRFHAITIKRENSFRRVAGYVYSVWPGSLTVPRERSAPCAALAGLIPRPRPLQIGCLRRFAARWKNHKQKFVIFPD